MSLLRAAPRAARASARTYATVSSVEAAGVKVAGIETGTKPATVSLTVVAKAGSRYENVPGVAHVLKNFAFKSTASGSALKNVRETELYGGSLSAALSREHLYLTAEFLRGDEAHFLSLLASVLSSTQFPVHEFGELVVPVVEAETTSSLADPVIRATDLAHALAFRRGLGNSLFATANSPVSIADVKAYASQAFAKSNLAVLGQGISTEALAKAVQSAFGSGVSTAWSELPTAAAKYYGGEVREQIDAHNPIAQPTLVLAYGLAGAASPALSALPHLLGGVPAVKWSVGSSPLAQAAAKVPGASAVANLLPYSDASLLTVTVQAPTSEGVRTVAEGVAAAIKAATSTKDAAAVKRAVAKAKLEAATRLERTEQLLTTVGPALFAGSVPAADSAFAALDKLDAAAVSKAAGELFQAKPTLVAIGDTHVLPYADELGL
ncbi:ubiquinol-cytochrome c reductase core subunit 1 [Cryptotrichosporon argae]